MLVNQDLAPASERDRDLNGPRNGLHRRWQGVCHTMPCHTTPCDSMAVEHNIRQSEREVHCPTQRANQRITPIADLSHLIAESAYADGSRMQCTVCMKVSLCTSYKQPLLFIDALHWLMSHAR